MDGEVENASAATAVHRTPFGLEPVSVDEVLGAIPYNAQRYENSKAAVIDAHESYHNSPDKLYNSLNPHLVIIHEKPEHRLAVFMKARNLDNNEIAERMGWTASWTSQVCRQPWFRIRLLEELTQAGRNQLDELFKVEAINSAFTLVDLRDNVKVPPAVRKAAADSLLDRFLGKPVAKIETSEQKLPSTEETRKIDAEIKSIDEQLNQPQNETPTVQTPNS
jgi:hypothetical protein